MDIAIPPPPEDAGVALDAARDAATADAIAEDVAADAPAPDPGPPDGGWTSAWCAANAPYAKLCDDFDGPIEPLVEWSPFGAAPTVVASTFSSSPNALEAKGTSDSYLSFEVANAPYGAKLEAEMQLVADGTSSTDAPVLAFIDAENGERMELAAVPGTDTARCTFAGASQDTPAIDFTLARGAAWHTLSFKLSFNDGGTNNFFCIVDGVDHGYFAVPASQALGNVTLGVGARGKTTTAMDVYWDNVVIDM